MLSFSVLSKVLNTKQPGLLTTLGKKPFENILGKGENACNQHSLLFQKMFSTLPKRNFNVLVAFILSSAIALNLNQSKILSFGKELTLPHNPDF